MYASTERLAVVVERLAPFRGTGELTDAMLGQAELPLAISELELADDVMAIDLDDPAVLVSERLRPSGVATGHRPVTQRMAADLFDRHGDAGALLWWSALEASWLNATVFDRAHDALLVRATEELTVEHPLVREAATFLGLRTP
ncbi:MAG TPA: hypothetical protein VF752_14710 [Thermoleophilaceae bacterium]